MADALPAHPEPRADGTRRRLIAAAGLVVAGCASPPPAPPAPPPPAARPVRRTAAAGERSAPADRAAGTRGGAAEPSGAPPSASRHLRADRGNWTEPSRRVDAFSRLDEIFPANISARPASPRAWRRARVPVAVNTAVDDYLARNPVTGLALARGDALLVERYRYDRRDTQRFTSFGMARTLVGMMVGVALDEGRFRALDDPAQAYLPSLAGSAWGPVPLRALLTLRSGVRAGEDDGDDVAGLTRATLGSAAEIGAPGLQVLRARQVAPPGERWAYAAGDSFLLALLLRARLRKPLSDYFAERIWKPMGAEADASWLVDRSGQELGFTGFNAVLRDWARVGMLLADRGAVGGRQAIPAGWIRDATRAQVALRQTGRGYGYGYQTWIFADDDGSFALLGEHGQALFVDPARRLVLVNTAVQSARELGGSETVALWRTLRRLV